MRRLSTRERIRFAPPPYFTQEIYDQIIIFQIAARWLCAENKPAKNEFRENNRGRANRSGRTLAPQAYIAMRAALRSSSPKVC